MLALDEHVVQARALCLLSEEQNLHHILCSLQIWFQNRRARKRRNERDDTVDVPTQTSASSAAIAAAPQRTSLDAQSTQAIPAAVSLWPAPFAFAAPPAAPMLQAPVAVNSLANISGQLATSRGATSADVVDSGFGFAMSSGLPSFTQNLERVSFTSTSSDASGNNPHAFYSLLNRWPYTQYNNSQFSNSAIGSAQSAAPFDWANGFYGARK